MDELQEAIIRAGRGVRRNELTRKAAAPPEPEPLGIIAVLPKKKLSREGRRMLAAAAPQNAATLTQIE